MPIGNLISSGIGLAFEANAARKAHKADKAARSTADTSPPESSSAPDHQYPEETLLDVSDKQARKLIDPGDAVPVASEKQRLPPDSEDDDPPPAYSPTIETDETDWQLDEASDDKISRSASQDSSLGEVPNGKEERQHYVDKIVNVFLAKHPSSAIDQAKGSLPCPVIIPQRRPHKKARGFVQAYAPVLAHCGIGQDSFMHFHKAMFKASQASPVFDVINIAAAIAGLVPSVAAMVTSMVVQAAAKTAIEIQSRQRSNSFLNQINDLYFRPRGLFCMIMKFDPNQHSSHERVDITSTIMKTLTSSDSRTKSEMKKLKSADGKTYGDLQMPPAAPLVYPNLDHVDDLDENGKPKGGRKKTAEFLANYYDKRAQAKYIYENEGTTLTSSLPQEQKFASRFGDPNHPANSGSLISLVSGGHVNPKERRQIGRHVGLGGSLLGALEGRSRDGRTEIGGRGSPAVQYGGSNPPASNGTLPPAQKGEMSPNSSMARGGFTHTQDPWGSGQNYPLRGQRHVRGHDRGRPLPIKMVKRMLQPNMLYLMIVNMPTEEEMQEARNILAASQRS